MKAASLILALCASPALGGRFETPTLSIQLPEEWQRAGKGHPAVFEAPGGLVLQISSSSISGPNDPELASVRDQLEAAARASLEATLSSSELKIVLPLRTAELEGESKLTEAIAVTHDDLEFLAGLIVLHDRTAVLGTLEGPAQQIGAFRTIRQAFIDIEWK